MLPFKNRAAAGSVLGSQLRSYAGDPELLILALPRGGVPVAAEVALSLDAPLDIFVVRKLGVPSHRELAMGAIASGGARILNQQVIEAFRIPPQVIDRAADQEMQEIERQERLYRGGTPAPDVRGRKVILVDDGLATGSTMRAAVLALRQLGPKQIIVAVPVGAREVCAEFEAEADDVICAKEPEPFHAVSAWYEEFSQTTDSEVKELLSEVASHIKSR